MLHSEIIWLVCPVYLHFVQKQTINSMEKCKSKQRKMVFKEVKQWRDQKRPTLFVMRNEFWNILLFVEMLVEDDAI